MNRNAAEMSSDTDRDVGNMTCQGEDNDTEYPLVFQCTNCNSILGDSLSWLCANEDLRTLTLSRKFLRGLSTVKTKVQELHLVAVQLSCDGHAPPRIVSDELGWQITASNI